MRDDVRDGSHPDHKIYCELMRLPKTMLRAMVAERLSNDSQRHIDDRIVWSRHVSTDIASLDDCAAALAPVLARRGFMRAA